MSETTHDLTQRAEEVEKRLRMDGELISVYDDYADVVRDLSAALVQAEQREEDARKSYQTMYDNCAVNVQKRSELEAQLVQAEQEKADILQKDRIKTHEINLLTPEVKGLEARLATQEAAQDQVVDILEHTKLQLQSAEACILAMRKDSATQEATIRQVEQEISRLLSQAFGLTHRTVLTRLRNSLLAILPAEQTEVTHE